jgi:hypothetical protein
MTLEELFTINAGIHVVQLSLPLPFVYLFACRIYTSAGKINIFSGLVMLGEFVHYDVTP